MGLFSKPRPKRAPIEWTRERAVRRMLALNRLRDSRRISHVRWLDLLRKIPSDVEVLKEVMRRENSIWRLRVSREVTDACLA